MLSYETLRDLLKGQRLPAALVDLDAFDRNAELIAERARAARGAEIPIRVATKSLRSPELLRRLLARRPFRGLMCRTADEAAFLAAEGFDDLMVAYPTFQQGDWTTLRDLHLSGKSVSLVADAAGCVDGLAAALGKLDRPFPVLIEADVCSRGLGGALRLGTLRSPLREPEAVLALINRLAGFPNLKFAGLLAYEALVAGIGDRNPFRTARNPIIGLLRRLGRAAARRKRQALADALAREGIACGLFNGGGSASVDSAAREPWLTELTAGSAFLCPHLFDYYSNLRLEPACFFALQATRTPEAGIVTCAGGGYVASGEPGWDRVPRPWLPAGAELVAAEGCGEVQTPVRLPPGASVALGEPVFFRHAKAGELAEHFPEYILVSKGRIAGRAKTYRGLGRSFL